MKFKMNNISNYAMKIAIEESKVNAINNYKNGGPFGAAIIKYGKIISSAHNTVMQTNDPTAHAEINAIRSACQKLKTNDLSNCVLYTSTEPCPMCLSAIIWSNIKEVYFANTRYDADDIGFRDDVIYKYLSGENKDILNVYHVNSKEAKEVFEDFKKIEEKTLY